MNNHKLTEFFPRKSQPKFKATGMPVNDINFNEQEAQDQEVISISSGSLLPTTIVADISNPPFPPKPRTRMVMAAVEIVSPRTSEKRRSQHPAKRSCSPEIQRMGPSKLIKQSSATFSKPSAKRKKKFDSDSDVEPLNTIIYVPKVPKSASLANTVVRSRQFGPLVPKENVSKARVRLPSYKKQRLSSPDPLAEDMVPSSQFDEQEMALPRPIKKDAMEMKDSVDKWRKTAVSSSPDALLIVDTAQALNTNMDVSLSSPLSEDSLSSLSPSPPETDVCARLKTMSTNASTKHLTFSQATPGRRTPALTAERPSVPATPMVLDVESKTSQIIAQIKAAAYAATFSSPEPEASELKPLDESSDDEAIHDPFSSPLSSPTVHPARRYNFRNQAAPSPSSFRSSARLRSPSKRLTRAARANKSSTRLFQGGGKEKDKLQARSTTHNPLEMLLKEKRLADKRGKGLEALLLAENTMVGKSMRAEMDEEQEHRSEGDWTNEEAALMAICEGGHLLGLTSSSPVKSLSGSDYLTLGETDRERLLGPKSGKAVTSILEDDKAKKEQTTGKDKALGVALWDATCAEMETTTSCPDGMPPDIFSGTEIQSVLRPLKNAVERGDASQATLFLDSGIIAAIGPSNYAGIVPVLYDLALSVHETCLSESAFRVLLHLWRDGHPAAVTIMPLVWTTLARLGAKVGVFLCMEWEIEMDKRDVNVDAAKRANIIYRLVSLLTTSARAHGLEKEDMPDILVVLLLLALDPSSSRDLKTDLTIAVDVVCRSLAPGADVCAEVEASISAKLIKFASNLTPINKAHLLSFMTGPHARTRRLARYLAYALLVGEEVVSNEGYRPLPPLSSLYELLTPSATSVGPFSVQELTDYEDMGYYVDIISVVLSDIDIYVAQEHYGGPVARNLDCSPSKGGKEKPLEIIRSAIDGIHARIADTRAAHLDRSRTKAALQRLSMRIYYQRLAALKSNQDSGKPRNLRDHWSSR